MFRTGGLPLGDQPERLSDVVRSGQPTSEWWCLETVPWRRRVGDLDVMKRAAS